jgi:hypothetical protein
LPLLELVEDRPLVMPAGYRPAGARGNAAIPALSMIASLRPQRRIHFKGYQEAGNLAIPAKSPLVAGLFVDARINPRVTPAG